VDESACQEVIVARPVDERRRLLGAERASSHLRKGESGLAQLVELGKISTGGISGACVAVDSPHREHWDHWPLFLRHFCA
jgi:hypothetical protein